jgi:hypothetical protein
MKNIRRYLIGGLILLIGLFLLPYLIYIIKFSDLDVVRQTETWGQFGDFIGGILNPFLALVNVIFLVMAAVYVSQIDNNRLLNEYRKQAYDDLIDVLDRVEKHKVHDPLRSNIFDPLGESIGEYIRGLIVYLNRYQQKNNFLFDDSREIFENLVKNVSLSLTNIVLAIEVEMSKNKTTIDVPKSIVEDFTKTLPDEAFYKTELAIRYEEYEANKNNLIEYIQRAMLGKSVSKFKNQEMVQLTSPEDEAEEV